MLTSLIGAYSVKDEDLTAWEQATGPLQCEFYFVEGLGGPFRPIPRFAAKYIEFLPSLGYPRCVALITAEKQA